MKIGGRHWLLGHWVLEFDILLEIGNWKFDILNGVFVPCLPAGRQGGEESSIFNYQSSIVNGR